MVKLRNIKVSEEEDENWNVKVIHFNLQNPNCFYNILIDILNNAQDLGIKITLDPDEQYLVRKYGGLI